jgi:hypothetical protein
VANEDQIRTIIKALDRVSERTIIKITLDIVANLIETTPVDTGWARANWVPALGAPYVASLDGIRPTTQMATSAAGEQSSKLAGVAGGYRLEQGKVFISNNVPYILDLNAGSSSKAPVAFVQRAIVKAITQDIRGLAT